MSMHHEADHLAAANDDQNRPADRPSGNFLLSRGGLVAIGFLLVAAFLLFSEHRAHVLGYLPFLLLLACPLMHLFMHHGHGGGHDHGGRPGAGAPPSRTEGGPR